MEDNLTTKQQKFIEHYLILGEGKQSAINAGYSEKTAEVQASRLLSNVKIQEELKRRRQALVNELQERFVTDALTARKTLVNILHDKEASHGDKIKAAKDLLDRAGFKPTDKKEISGSNGDPIQIVFTNPD